MQRNNAYTTKVIYVKHRVLRAHGTAFRYSKSAEMLTWMGIMMDTCKDVEMLLKT